VVAELNLRFSTKVSLQLVSFAKQKAPVKVVELERIIDLFLDTIFIPRCPLATECVETRPALMMDRYDWQSFRAFFLWFFFKTRSGGTNIPKIFLRTTRKKCRFLSLLMDLEKIPHVL
jgi:hypothetical protein